MLLSRQFLIFACFAALIAPAFAAENRVEAQASVTEIESPAHVEAGVLLESGGKWQSEAHGGLNHNLILSAGWATAPGWRLGLDSEVALTSSADDAGGVLDTELTLARTGISLGQYGEVSGGSLTILPSSQAERNAGLHFAQGAILAWGLEFSPDVTLGVELRGARFFRGAERASHVVVPAQEASAEMPASPEVLAAAGTDRWRFQAGLQAGWKPTRKIGLQISVGHSSGWKWFGGREDILTTEQRLSYALEAGWSLGIGHRNETSLVAQDGTRARAAFFRPEESKLYGTLAWEL